MKALSVLMAFLWLIACPSLVMANEDAIAAYQSCIACHGESGQGNPALGSPALAGQDAAYLQRQLMHFKTGVRGSDPRDTLGAQMKAMAAPLSDEDVELLAEYLSALPVPVVSVPPSADLKNGNNYYHSKCGACHGGKAEGNPGLNSPALAWLDSAYLKHQFKNFQLGIRGKHPQDTYGRQMKMMSTSLPSDKDLDDVIAFIQSQAPSR